MLKAVILLDRTQIHKFTNKPLETISIGQCLRYFCFFQGGFAGSSTTQMRKCADTQIRSKDTVHHNPPWWPTPCMIRHQYLRGFALNARMRTKTISSAWAQIAMAWCRAACSTPLILPVLPWINLLLPPRVGMWRGQHQRCPPPLLNESLCSVRQRLMQLQVLWYFLVRIITRDVSHLFLPVSPH